MLALQQMIQRTRSNSSYSTTWTSTSTSTSTSLTPTSMPTAAEHPHRVIDQRDHQANVHFEQLHDHSSNSTSPTTPSSSNHHPHHLFKFKSSHHPHPPPSDPSDLSVNVVCRLRPRLKTEPPGDQSVVQVINPTEIRITDPHKRLVNRFDFSACYDEHSTQQDIYDGQVLRMISKVFDGTTATIFTFGCTGSGKTHTLQGTPTDPGITPRAIRSIFERLEVIKTAHQQSSDYSISISCYEIWKDKVWDLLVEGGTTTTRDVGRGDLPIREASDGQILIPNLRHVKIKSINQFDKLYAQVMRFRSVSSTKLNHASSRSHAILTIHVSYQTDPQAPVINGRCVLIDLAGSENNKKTGNESNKERMKESVEINQSLLALRKVVRSLNTGDHRIPYRDSKLTRILSDSLGGTSAGLVICNVAPGASQYRDTMNTLTFGSHSRNVENKAPPKASEASDRKFLLPSLSLYPYQSKSTSHLPPLSPGTPTSTLDSTPIRTGSSRPTIKLNWSKQKSLDVLTKLPSPSTMLKAPVLSPGGTQSSGSNINMSGGNVQFGGKASTPSPNNTRPRKFSHCLSSPSSIIKAPGGLKRLHHRASSSNLLGMRNHHSPTNLGVDHSSSLEIDRKVQEAMRKNLDEIVQDRVDALLNARLKENGLRSSKDSTNYNLARDLANEDRKNSKLTTTTTGVDHNNCSKINLEDEDELFQRITNLEKQFVNISTLLQNVAYSPRPDSMVNTRIPRPKS